jgi:hypothetical protein
MTGVYCRGLTLEDQKSLFYTHLYYSRVDTQDLREALKGTHHGSHEELASVRTAIFGYERTSPALTSQFRPIQEFEIEREVLAYQNFENAFSREDVRKRPHRICRDIYG